MAYQLDVQSSLVNVHSRFISRIFQSQDYQSYNDTKIIQNYIQRKKDSGKIDDKISLQYSNRNGQIQNYHLRLVTFFLKEGIHHVALAFIQNDCFVKLIDVKYGFDNNNNTEIQILFLKFIDQFNLWSAFSPQISRLLSSIQPYRLFQLINTYPAIRNNVSFNNPQFVIFTLNNVHSNLKALQFSEFSSQVNDQLSNLQSQFQQLSDKESLLIQKEQDQQHSRPPLSSYPIRPSFTSASIDYDKEHADTFSNSPKSRNLSQTLLLDPQPQTPPNNISPSNFNDNPFNILSNQPSPSKTPTAPLSNQPSTLPLPNQPSPPPKPAPNQVQPSSPQQTPTNLQPSPVSSLFDSPKQPPLHNSQFLLSYLHNQLSSYFDTNSNKTSKTKITKEVKQLLKQKTIQKNSLFQQYIDSHSNNLNSEQHKLLQKWFDTKLSS